LLPHIAGSMASLRPRRLASGDGPIGRVDERSSPIAVDGRRHPVAYRRNHTIRKPA
jgi:hypothetical protein